MPDDFIVARNPEADSALPYVLRIPLGRDGIVLKAREVWPRTAKVYCHRTEWPDEPDIVERTPTRSCVRRGAAIDLVLDRARENRSQFVLTYVRGGREAIFWQTARTTKQARPHGRPSLARAGGRETFEIVVDAHERYAWTFRELPVTTRKQALAAGDYGVYLDEALVASVERKSLEDLSSTLTSGRLRYVLADLAALPRAAVVVEERYSRIFNQTFVKPAVFADGLAECQARFPSVPIVFAETRPLAQQWTYRFLAACLDELDAEGAVASRVGELPGAELPVADVQRAPRVGVRLGSQPSATEDAGATPAEIRAWALAQGLKVADRGRLRPEVLAAYRAAHV